MNAQIVSFYCVLKNKMGQILSSSFNQDVINQIDKTSHSQESGPARLQGLVDQLQNVRPGEKREFTVLAHEAYGLYDPKLVVTVTKSDLPSKDEIKVGSMILMQLASDRPKQVYQVLQILEESVLLDGNHPFAGQDLNFEIEVTSARDACQEDYDETFVTSAGQYLH